MFKPHRLIFQQNPNENPEKPQEIAREPEPESREEIKNSALKQREALKAEIDQKHHLDNYLKTLEAEKDYNKLADEFSKTQDIEQLRQGNVSLEDNLNNIYKKHAKLSSAYMLPEKSENGHLAMLVDFKGNDLAEWNVGAGHMLPPEIKAIKVYDETGAVVCERAERGIQAGRVGYFGAMKQSGETGYIAVHTGYKIEILETQETNNEETQQRIKAENEHFILMGYRSEIRNRFEKYIKSEFENSSNITIDDDFIRELAEDLKKEKPDMTSWKGMDFDALVKKYFEDKPKETVLIKNLLSADYNFNLSDIKKFAEDPKLKDLTEKKLTPEEVKKLTQIEPGSTFEYGSIVPKPEIAENLGAINGRERGNNPITEIILHDTASFASGETMARYLAGNNPRGVSSHFLIDRNGKLIQMCPEDKIAYHTVGHNKNSIGIDFANKNFIKDKSGRIVGYEPYTEAQCKTAAQLIAYVCTKYKFPLSRVIGHKDTQYTDHVDPSPVFDWPKVRQMAEVEIEKYKNSIAAKKSNENAV